MTEAVRRHAGADALVFLGDGERDFEETLAECGIAPFGPQERAVYQVCGNCDRFSSQPLRITASFEGVNFLIAHGHEQNVKFGYARLAMEAKSRGCAAALFGHTHLQCLEEKEGIVLLNPGSIRSGKYAVVTVEDGKIRAELKRL